MEEKILRRAAYAAFLAAYAAHSEEERAWRAANAARFVLNLAREARLAGFSLSRAEIAYAHDCAYVNEDI